MVKTISEYRFGLPSVLFDLYRPDVVQVYSDLIAPYGGDHYQQHQFLESWQVGQVGRLDVEAAGLHGLEAHLYLPPPGIIALCFLWPVERNDDQKIALLQPAPRKVAELPVDRDDLVVMPVLSYPRAAEQVEGLDLPFP